MTDTLPPAIPAATLIVLREAAGPPELLMVERAAAMVFAPGALVFPGGRIDPGDEALARAIGTDPDDGARVAAIRETIEEVGLGIGLTPALAGEALPAIRAALHGGAAIAAALAMAGASLDPAALTPFARWCPAHRQPRRYDTRFYLARLSADAPLATVDGTENVRLLWSSARDVLAGVAAGSASVIFPTLRTLERLARFATVDQAFADARAHPIETVTPWTEMRDGVEHLCIPEGLGYPVTAEPLEASRRG